MDNKKHTEQTVIIPIEEWHALSMNDTCIKVKIKLMGHSMQPLIRRNKDFVTIQPMKRKVLRGDIVLFRNIDGRYIVHRVRNIRGKEIQTMGDNCLNPDKAISEKEILGYVTHVHRGRRTFFVDTPVWRFLGCVRLGTLPFRKTVRFIFKPIKRFLGRLVR